jgi:hypothetical protein
VQVLLLTLGTAAGAGEAGGFIWSLGRQRKPGGARRAPAAQAEAA